MADRYQRPAGPSLGDFGAALATAEPAPAAGGPPAAGFVVKGGPWEQRAPEIASPHEFPTMPGGPQAAPAAAVAATTAAPSVVWGPRR